LSPRHRRWLGWGIALAILAACLLVIEPREMLATLGRLRAWQVAGLLLLMTLDRLLMVWKWRLLLAVQGVRLPMGAATGIYYEGSFAGSFLPSQVGGDLLRGWRASGMTGRAAPVWASLVMERVLGLVSALNWGTLGTALCLALVDPGRRPLWLGLGALGLLCLNGGFWAAMRPGWHGWVQGLLQRWGGGRGMAFLQRLHGAFAHFGNRPRALLGNFLLTLAEHALQMLIVLLTALALGIEADSAAFLAATAAQMVLARLPVAPDGWGIAELGAIGVYGLVGIDATAAFSLSVTGHVLVLLTLMPGAFFLLRHTRRRPGGVAT
jgi:uncharacterized membrane protein YbhN (UPF0104 family)